MAAPGPDAEDARVTWEGALNYVPHSRSASVRNGMLCAELTRALLARTTNGPVEVPWYQHLRTYENIAIS